MKKSTKKIVMALVIVLIFGMSSIAFFATSFVNPQQQQFKPLQSPIVNGKLDPAYKQTYVQAGYTWLEYYYIVQDSDYTNYLEGLPESLTTQSGAPQIIVQKINEKYLDYDSYVTISSPFGEESFNETDQQKTFDALCRLLTSRPIECGFENLTA